jgi:hypothetical protein
MNPFENTAKTRWIIADKILAFSKTFDKIKQKAAQFGLPEPTMQLTGKEKIFHLPVYDSDRTTQIGTIPCLKAEVLLKGAMPLLHGHRLLAKISHEKHENGSYQNLLITPSEKSEQDLLLLGRDFHHCSPNCDHCKSSRNRDTTFILQKNNEIVQVGSTCIDDYLGESSLAAVLTAFDACEIIQNDDLYIDMDKEHTLNKSRSEWFPIASYVAMANDLTLSKGFTTTDNSDSTRQELVDAILYPNTASPTLKYLVQTAFKEPRESLPEADSIIRFFREQNSESTYIKNVQSLLSSDYLRTDNAMATGILASIPNAYYSQIKRRNKTINAAALNEPFGTIKERGSLKLTVSNVREDYSKPIPKIKYSLHDDAGRKFSWATTPPGNRLLSIGNTVLLTGTISDHFFWSNTHYTKLTRCADIESTPPDTPIPDFGLTAASRTFKEKFSFDLLITDDNGIIDGDTHIHYNRTWRENGKALSFYSSLPLDLGVDFKQPLISLMSSVTGVDRAPSIADDYVDIHNKSDQKFLIAAKEFISQVTKHELINNNVFYYVDDAFVPLFCSDNPTIVRPAAPMTSTKNKRPLLFSSLEQAREHAEQMPNGRIVAAKIKTPKATTAPYSIRFDSIVNADKYRQHASDNGANILFLIDEGFNLRTSEPLNWNVMTPGVDFEILWDGAAHCENKEHNNSYFLAKRNFITISGLTGNMALAKNIKDNLYRLVSHYDNPNVTILNLPENYNLSNESSPYLSSLTELSTSTLGATDERFTIAVVDNATSYYLDRFGANVINIEVNNLGHPTAKCEFLRKKTPSSIINLDSTDIEDCMLQLSNNIKTLTLPISQIKIHSPKI